MIFALRQLLRAVQLRGQKPWLAVRIAVGWLMFVPLVAVLVFARLRAALRGPWKLPAETLCGTRMNCLLPDVVQLYIFLFGVWEPDITAFVRRRLAKGDMFIDVGAHAGYYSLLASQLVGPEGRVVSIEASPFIFQILHDNLALSAESMANVRTVHAAAAAQTGELTIHLGPVWNLGWSTTLAERGLTREAVVAAAPLDELLTEEEIHSARLVKIDVEGNERDVIAGMARLIRDCRPEAEFLIELSPLWWKEGERSSEAVLAPFFAAGFRAYLINNDYLPWRYLWPFCVQAPHRVSGSIKSWIGQVDLLLSRETDLG